MPQFAQPWADEHFVAAIYSGIGAGAIPRDPFLDNAAAILDTATSAQSQEDWTILIGHDGQLEMLAASDWPLDSLARERGARMAFRVTRESDGVKVEGRQGLRTCSFETEAPQAALLRTLNRPAVYLLQG